MTTGAAWDPLTGGSKASVPVRAPDALVELPNLLVRSENGIEFVYRALDLVAARYGLRDVAVVVEGPNDPQLFRLARRPLELTDRDPAAWLVPALAGKPGLYSDPPAVDAVTCSFVTSMAELALRLELLRHDASHDALTGLLNRRSYELVLGQAVGRAQRYGWPFALVVLDLDEFKVINDRYGHAAGDALLRAVGTELRSALRSGDVAARLGGDEFALLVVGVDDPESLQPLLQRLQSALERAVPEASVGFSVGVACFPGDTDESSRLMTLADERLYAAKARVG
jgi:diguanylate cyclase (GGDEF)-like protein